MARTTAAPSPDSGPCSLCGSKTRDPKGQLLHRFAADEIVVARQTGMVGTVVFVPHKANARARIGVKVAWTNGFTGWVRPANLDHAEVTR